MRRERLCGYLLALAGLLCAPGTAWAQSAIAGVVRDTSGAVIQERRRAARPILVASQLLCRYSGDRRIHDVP